MLIGVRMLDPQLDAIDVWISKQKKPHPSRPEAIRRLVDIGLAAKFLK